MNNNSKRRRYIIHKLKEILSKDDLKRHLDGVKSLQKFIDKEKVEKKEISYEDLIIALELQELLNKPIQITSKRLRILLVGFKIEDLPFEKKFDIKSNKYVPNTSKGIESVNWNAFSKRTLYDYDVIILDISNLIDIVNAARYKKQIEEFLNVGEGGLLIVFSSKEKCDITKRFTNYSLIPVPSNVARIYVTNEKSEEFSPGETGPYRRILNYYRGQGFYFKEPFPESSLPLAINKKCNTLGLAYWVGIGRIILLPEVSPKKDVVSIILDDIIPNLSGVAPPSWADNYPFLDEQKLRASHEQIERTLNDYAKWKSLLYGTGYQLTRIVWKSLIEMRFNVIETERSGEHDLEIDFGNNILGIAEVTGSTRKINVDKVSQLNRFYDLVKIQRPGINVKGILIVNSEHDKDPTLREESFNIKAVSVAETLGFCLVTSHHLYEILQLFLDKKLTKERLSDLLRKTVGVLNLDMI